MLEREQKALGTPDAPATPSAAVMARKAIDAMTPRSAAAEPRTPVPGPTPTVAASAGGRGAAEAEELVKHDLAILQAGIVRLVEAGNGEKGADGSYKTTFGAVVDDEELEQKLESLVGTLKAGRKQGVLDWKGQMLLKGPNDNEPITLLPPTGSAAPPATPAPPAPAPSVADAAAPPAEAEVEIAPAPSEAEATEDAPPPAAEEVAEAGDKLEAVGLN